MATAAPKEANKLLEMTEDRPLRAHRRFEGASGSGGTMALPGDKPQNQQRDYKFEKLRK